MAHLYKATHWESATGKHHIADVQDLGSGSAVWWVPAKLLGMTLSEYAEMLITKYAATVSYKNDFMHVHWESKTKANSYKNWINKCARENQWIICGDGIKY